MWRRLVWLQRMSSRPRWAPESARWLAERQRSVVMSALRPLLGCRRPAAPRPSADRGRLHPVGRGTRGGQSARGYPTRRAMRQVTFGAVAAIVAALALWHPARVAVQTLLLLPALFPSAPIDPLALVTANPIRDHQTYDYSAGTIDIEFFAPASGGRHAAIMLLLGAGDVPRSDLAIHLASALARLGVVTSLPESSGMLAEHLSFDEVDAIRVSLRALDARPDVDSAHVGLVSLSASGGLSIVAAAQPDLRDDVRFVNSFGSYDDATSLLIDVASRSIEVDGMLHEWQPEPRTVEVVSSALAEAGVKDPDRTELMAGTSRDRAMAISRGF